MKRYWQRSTKKSVRGWGTIRILFLTENIYPAKNASTNCLSAIVECLCNRGNECIFVTNQKNAINEDVYFVNANKVYNYGYPSGKKSILTELRGTDSLYRKISLIMTILFNTIKLKVFSLHPLLLNLKVFGLAKYSAEVAKNENVDAVVSIGAPFDFHSVGYLSYKLHKRKWVMYSFDPNHTYDYYKNLMYLKYEDTYTQNCAASIVTKLMYEEYKEDSLNKYMYKIIPMEFPNLTLKSYHPQEDDVIFDDKYINCVFVGSLYNDIRNPEFLLQLIKNTNLRLYIIGKIYEGFPSDYFDEWQEQLGDRFIITGLLTPKAAVNAMLKADILINIGNTVANQLPSKLIDYISTGKPIVNICKLEKCPSLKYMSKYPVCLNILEGELNNTCISEFDLFCKNNIGNNVEFNKLLSIYSECTPGYVADRLIKAINES